MPPRSILLALLPALVVAAPTAAPQCTVEWRATDGLLPDQSMPAWSLFDSSPTPPSLGAGSLKIETQAETQHQYYLLSPIQVQLPTTLIIETSVWYVSGSSSSAAREAVSIVFDTAPGRGNAFFVGRDEIFLDQADGGTFCNRRGNSVALPTMDGFHEYRLVVDTVGGAIDVYYDGAHSGLTGTLFAGTQCFFGPRLIWGEGSVSAMGISEWAYLRHNAGATGSVVPYCTPGTSASGCRATLSASGVASASAGSGFVLSASNVEGDKTGIFFYGVSGRLATPWGNGTSLRCVAAPVKRAGVLTATGTPGQCDGAFSRDLSALWAAFPNKNPGAGARVQAQLWYRDPGNPSNKTTSFSDALEFLVCP